MSTRILIIISALTLLSVVGAKPIGKRALKLVERQLLENWKHSVSADDFKGKERFLIECDNEELLSYLTVKRRVWKGVEPGTINAELREKTLELIQQWPSEIQRYLNSHVAEIFIVRNFGASGYILTTDNNRFTILVDESVVVMKPNEWFRMKEGTVVDLESSDVQLLHRIEKDSVDLPERLLEGILIHELAHCIGISEGWHTAVDGNKDLMKDLSLFDGVFDETETRLKMKSEIREKFRQLRYYQQKEKLTLQQYQELLEKLPQSPFPTLYATVSDLEFFAEYFYTYVHCIVQKRPLNYTLVSGKDTLLNINSPINSSLNIERVEIIQSSLSRL